MSGHDEPMWGERADPPLLERLRRRLAPLIDRLDVPPRHVVPLLSICLGFRADNERGGWGGRISLGDADTTSLYYNGALYLRLMATRVTLLAGLAALALCLGGMVEAQWLALGIGYIGVGVRWRGRGEGREFAQAHLGWRLNGQFGVAFRVQSDDTAARGTTGPNYGQAPGWREGTK